MQSRVGILLALATVATLPLTAQTNGAIAGRVRDRNGQPINSAQVAVDAQQARALTNAAGVYRLREVRSGWHRVRASAIGFRPVINDSVLVRAGATSALDFVLDAEAVELEPLVITAPIDSVLDPLAPADVQRVTADDFRRLPVSSIDEALVLAAGVVGESYRGGRLGQQSFIFDGLGVKNQLDASTGGLGLRLPPDLLTEVGLITNGFSARYGQAVSGLVNVITKDGGDNLQGRLAYETDRPLGNGWDYGLDRAVAQADGPLLGKIRFAAVADAVGRLDADPVKALAPTNTLDPRFQRPWLLPHNAGEQLDLAGKLFIPIGGGKHLRLFALRSEEQRLLYDQAYKYDENMAPARRLRGHLLSAHLQQSFDPRPLRVDLRVGYFSREYLQGALERPADQFFGAFTGQSFRFVGQDLARAQDTAAAQAAIPGLPQADFSERTPWGVPAFFLGSGPSGDLSWNHFRELRGQLDVTLGTGQGDLFLGGEIVRQRVRTFQRVMGGLPVGDSVPPPTASSFTPLAAALYAESQFRLADLGITAGLRYDGFDSRTDLPGQAQGSRHTLNPRLAVSTVLAGATLVASWGAFSQAPDYQYLVDAAFDDSLRTGRFRRGNPDLGYERAWQYELSLRARPTPKTSLRINVYFRRLEGLVASVPLGVDPDSSIFGNADAGSVKGGELIFERDFERGIGVKVAYTLQQAEATATNAFFVRRTPSVDPITGDTTFPAKVEFPLDFDRRHGLTAVFLGQVPDLAGPTVLGVRPLGGIESAAIFRLSSGLPFTRSGPGDSIIGLPNSSRLPSTFTLDLLVRRPVRWYGLAGSFYLDVRNVFNRRNTVAVRRDTGQPTLTEDAIVAMAESAYAAHPEPIPFESPRYRGYADLDHNAYVDGRAELFPLYLAAARDFVQPIFSYGPPRLLRVGLEVSF